MIHTVVLVKPITNHWVQYTHTWPWYTLWCLWNQSQTTGCNTPTPDHDTHCGVSETNHKPLGAIHPHLTMIHTVVLVKPITNHWVQYTHTWLWYTLWCLWNQSQTHWVQYTHTWLWYTLWCLWNQSQTTGCNTPTPDYDTHCGVCETNHKLGAIHPHLDTHCGVCETIHPHLTMIHTVVLVKPITNHWVQYTHTWPWYTLWCLWNQSQTTGCNTPTPDHDTHCGVCETNHKPLGAIHPHLTMIHTVVLVKPITTTNTPTPDHDTHCGVSETNHTPTPDYDTHCGVCETNHKPLGAIHPHLTMIHTVVLVKPITNHWVQYTHTWLWYTLWCLWNQSQTTGCNTPTPDHDTHCGVCETNHKPLGAIHPHLTMIHTVVLVKPITNHWVQYTHTWPWYTLWC